MDPEDEDVAGGAATTLEPAAARRDVHRLLGLLTHRQREAVQCVRLLGLSVAETSSRLGMSESAVKVTIHRAIKRMALAVGARAHES
jgi:RNA polymerase sigma-70 factor, ECF subfamily